MTDRTAREAALDAIPVLVSLTEAADRYGVSTKTLRRRIAEGAITGHRLGPRIIRVDVRELDALWTTIPSAKSGAVA